MDCLCCADHGAGAPSHSEFVGSICRLASFPDAKFPAEPGRYAMYVVAGCPFAARPWMVLSFYGLADTVVPIVKCFPASHADGWFFKAVSEGEKELLEGFPDAEYANKDPYHDETVTHVKQLYDKADPDFKGAISVPLLWDTQKDTAVSNSSLGLAEMMATQMRNLATRNQGVLLFPTEDPEEYSKHSDLVKELHSKVTTVVYKINATKSGREHDRLVDEYYETLQGLQDRIANNGPYLMGSEIRFADFVLVISLIRLDLAYQWRFGLGRRSVRENYPVLFEYMNRILRLPGISEAVLPRDIMALYFMTPKWVQSVGRTLPQVPESWETKCVDLRCKRSMAED